MTEAKAILTGSGSNHSVHESRRKEKASWDSLKLPLERDTAASGGREWHRSLRIRFGVEALGMDTASSGAVRSRSAERSVTIRRLAASRFPR